MGFIKQSNTKTVSAYLTPLGRKYVLDGDREEFEIKFFSLHDEDTNYFISSNIISANTYNTLKSGFVPDITGDDSTCIKSIAKASEVNIDNVLFGSQNNSVGFIGTDGEINTRLCFLNLTSANPNLVLGNNVTSGNLTLNVILTSPDGTPVTSTEINNVQFYLNIIPQNVRVGVNGGTQRNNVNIQPVLINITSTTTVIQLSYTSDLPVSINNTTIPVSISVTIEPYRSFVNLDNNNLTFTGSATSNSTPPNQFA
jgi:hypothetical protein